MNVTFNFNPYNKLNFTARSKYGWTRPDAHAAYNVSRIKGAAPLLDTYQPSKVKDRLDTQPAKEAYGTLRPKHVSEVVLMYNTPEELTEYLTGLYRRVQEYDNTPCDYNETAELARGVLSDITLFLDCKVDLNRLGRNIEDMSDLEKIEYAAQFAFFTTNLEGTRRNNYVRPGYIRSANEYVRLVENKHPLYAASEFNDIMKRLPQGLLHSDAEIQERYDSDYKRQCLNYKNSSNKEKRSMKEPKPKYSPIYGKLKRLKELQVQTEIEYAKSRERREREEHQRWIDDTFMNTN